jgi:hypothetical protein
VYVIRRPDAREYKIGITRDPLRRFHDIQANHGAPLELMLAFRAGEQVERHLTFHFAACRIRGEWYRETPELLDWIARQRHAASTAGTIHIATSGATTGHAEHEVIQ